MRFLVQLLTKTFIETLYLTGMIILSGLLLGILRNHSIKNFQRSFGSKAVMITGFIGVPIHELSHAMFALLFGHKVTEIKLLQKPDEKGVMGYVQHSYNQRSIYQQIGNFFIGVAPIFGGVISIIVLMRFTIPQAYNKFIYILIKNLHVTAINKAAIEGILSSYVGLVKTIFSLRNFQNPYFFIFVLVAICISSHISLSSADIKGASRGLGIIFLILLILNALDLSKYISTLNIIKYNILITGFLIVSIIFSAITFLISLVLVMIRCR
ncbi:M50 family metallopeptidase [Clostridium sp. DJ247]|uniref:M50 family metallopeptidase n=1 Tax=Clostridium sp. DJ247 TaxID=2726188 RepID=UPI0016257FA5|nr:M50 family metallopeptidase [Clostridium sp. DJ247]MBC2582255.1 hypothetical protein [Clostridium sp. DJ247]